MKPQVLVVCLIISYLADCIQTTSAESLPNNELSTFAKNLVRTLVDDRHVIRPGLAFVEVALALVNIDKSCWENLRNAINLRADFWASAAEMLSHQLWVFAGSLGGCVWLRLAGTHANLSQTKPPRDPAKTQVPHCHSSFLPMAQPGVAIVQVALALVVKGRGYGMQANDTIIISHANQGNFTQF